MPPLPDGARRDVYARFIPKEELSSFAAWEFGDVSDGSIESPGVAAGVARASEPEPIDPAELIAQQIKAARQSGYQDGYRDGLVALDGFKQSFASQTTAQVGTLVTAVGEQLDAMQEAMATSLAATATALARQVLRSELAATPQSVVVVAEQAIDALLLSARHIVMRVHPDDHALIVAGAAEAIAARGVRLVADAQIGRGGCLVQSDIGLVDATIEERWRRAAASLGQTAAWTDTSP
ncbi:MAG: FliH/SctL family protein [Caldimonas sp.]